MGSLPPSPTPRWCVVLVVLVECTVKTKVRVERTPYAYGYVRVQYFEPRAGRQLMS